MSSAQDALDRASWPLGGIAGSYADGRWACFHVMKLAEPRLPGLQGEYEHHSLVEAMAAFEPLVDDLD